MLLRLHTAEKLTPWSWEFSRGQFLHARTPDGACIVARPKRSSVQRREGSQHVVAEVNHIRSAPRRFSCWKLLTRCRGTPAFTTRSCGRPHPVDVTTSPCYYRWAKSRE